MIASGSLQPSSYSLPIPRPARQLLARFGPVAPQFGQKPWNCFPPANRILPRAFQQNGQSRVYQKNPFEQSTPAS